MAKQARIMFFKILCIFVCFKFENIGNNGPFPLPMYCTLPIASLDLIECIYCLNDKKTSTKSHLSENSSQIMVYKTHTRRSGDAKFYIHNFVCITLRTNRYQFSNDGVVHYLLVS